MIHVYSLFITYHNRRSDIMENKATTAGKCPVMHGGNTATGNSNMDWWPKSLNLDILHSTTARPTRWEHISITVRR